MNELRPTGQSGVSAGRRRITRRRVLQMTGGATVLVLGGGTLWLAGGPRPALSGIADAVDVLDVLSGQRLTSTGEWSVYRIFSHAAQSVEMSMRGYPRHRHPLFKTTAGSLAYALFRRRGRMRHDLSEPIPGAPAIEADGDIGAALRRLRGAMLAFDAFDGALAPHFAYGRLTRSEYAAAHVMHLQDHLQEIVAA